MKIYLDVCSIQRPLDSQTQIRIILESEAILGVLTLVETGALTLVVSDAHSFEINRNPHPTRKKYALNVVGKAALHVTATDSIKEQVQKLNTIGIKPLDALHLASAIEANCAYFCTCDDRFYKKAKLVDTGSMTIVTPLELVAELGI